MLGDLLLNDAVDTMADGDSVRIPNGPVEMAALGETEEKGSGDQPLKGSLEGETDGMNCFGRPGSQIDDKVVFRNKFGETVSAIPVVVDFRRVLQLGQVNETDGVISGVSNRDLLHAVVGLYDISLSDMESETIYATVCARWARTIVLVQDLKDAADDVTERSVKRRSRQEKKQDQKTDSKKDKKMNNDKPDEKDWRTKVDEKEDIYKVEEEQSQYSAFVDIFSDTDEEEEDEEEGEEGGSEEENFTKGIHTFLKHASERRKRRDLCDGICPPTLIGIENRLLACVTFEKKFIEHKDKVIHLTLISVRPRYRMYRMGRYLLSKCVMPSVVGQYEAVVVHADHSAVEFFRKFGFSDDPILNSKWSELAEAFTNCTLMTYLPAFSCHSLVYTHITKEQDEELFELDQEFKMWQKKNREAYQGQLCCVMKYRNEILQLKHLVKTQNQLLNKLVTDNDKVRQEKLLVEKDLLSLQLDSARNAFSNAVTEEGADEINTEELLHDLEEEVASLTARIQLSAKQASAPPPPAVLEEPKVSAPFAVDSNTDIISRFVKGMEADRTITVHYSVSSILKAPNNPSLRPRFQTALTQMQDSTMVTELYYCGSLEKSNRLPDILANGFTEADFTHGEFGKGLYFSKFPSKAAQFSTLGKLLEVRVGLGKVETVMRYDRTRKAPSENNDSIIVPGRLYRPGDQGELAMLCQEYVVFNVNQVLPLCILSYTYVANSMP